MGDQGDLTGINNFLSNIKIKSQNIRSFNVSTFGDVTKKKLFYTIRGNYDVIFLSDTRLNSGVKPGPLLELKKLVKTKGYTMYANSTTSSRGVCILIREKLNLEILADVGDLAGNFLLLKVKIRNNNVVLGSIYGPNRNEDINVFNELLVKAPELDCNNIILGGGLELYMGL